MQEVLWLLATCVAVVPFISEMPGGSSVLGFLMGGALIGPHALGIVQNVNTVSHIAEFGVVFLMFNIGLELSLERLQSMQKYVFGLGSVQVLSCALAISVVSVYLYGMAGPASVLVGCGLALSSTAVALQVLQDRGESNNRHGRATFSALLVVGNNTIGSPPGIGGRFVSELISPESISVKGRITQEVSLPL